MKILILIWIILFALVLSIPLVVSFVENKFGEDHPFMKWWRRNVVGHDHEGDNHK